MARRLQFESEVVSEGHRLAQTPCLVDLGDGIYPDAELITIDGIDLDVDPSIVKAIADTAGISRMLEKSGDRIDCNAFAVILCGGVYVSTGDYQTYHSSGKKANFRKVVPTEEHDTVARVMEPLSFAIPFSKGVIWPRHVGVRVTEREGLYVNKFGDWSIAISDTVTLAEYYGTTLAASVLDSTFTSWTGEVILKYRSPDYDQATPEATYSS